MISRNDRQKQIVDKWINSGQVAGFEAVTGFGKTRCAILSILRVNPKSTIVIVPTKELKKQWTIELKKWKVSDFKVYVVNTAYKLELECDMMILDEVHTVGAATQFSKCWTNANYNKLLWLTATFNRKDGQHKKLLKVAPKIDSVTFKEALDNGWVSDFNIFNVSLDLTPEEQIKYNNILSKLDILYQQMAKAHSCDVEYASRNAFDLANLFFKIGTNYTKSLGAKYYNLIGQRKALLYNASNKLHRTVNYIHKNPDKKVLVFSQSQEFADALQDKLGDICVTIHSNLTDKNREYNLKRFKDKRTKVRVISSIKALNEGVDIPILDVGICASGTSSKKDAIQQLGRIVRLYKDKHALFFNLYIKDSQDFYWLKNRLYDLPDNKIKWIV